MHTLHQRHALRCAAAAVAALLVALACGTTQGTSSGPAANVPGVTDKDVLIGTTTPLSGAASAYAPVSKGATAYFQYVNARGGVNGRTITYKVYDDAYDPAKAVPLVRQLVTQDNVFAVVNELGTPVNLATRDYLNQEKVPDLFVATGSSHWGADYKQYPYTIGYQPDYVSEGKVYAKDILKSHPNAKIGILYQNDDYGKDYVNGLKTGLADKATSMVIDAETYEANAAEVNSQVASIKSKGADLFFIVATPKFAAQAIAVASKLSWKPAIYLNNVGAQVPTIMNAIKASSPDAAEGIVSSTYGKDPADRATWGNDPGMKLYYDILAKYCAGCDPNDAGYLAGMGAAWLFQQVLQKAGRNGVTRENVMKLTRNMNLKDSPFLLPGITIQTSGDNQFPITQMALMRWQGTGWVIDKNVISAR
ncbi:MAG TPA: ABC transporter substrate-binding protein [Candidatus Dormibacteraeota bacterium]|nr:ABC transporter substrate-binding protein [Candidatus Dormibacteraeota bacterium]